MEEDNKMGFAIGGMFFVGFMFVGAGIGFVYHAVHIGGAIGMGVGFLALGATVAYYKGK